MLVGRWFAGTPAMSCPSIRMVPAVGSSKPAMQRSSVVLPQPDGPSSEKNSPSRISAETPSSAVTSPNRFSTVQSSIRARGSLTASPPGRPAAAARRRKNSAVISSAKDSSSRMNPSAITLGSLAMKRSWLQM